MTHSFIGYAMLGLFLGTTAVFSIKRKRSAGVPVTAAVHRLITRGNAARDRRDWRRSADLFRQALQINPDLVHIWVQLGNMAKEHGSMEESEAAYLRALQLRPHNAEPLLQLGHLFNIRRNYAKASHYYLRAFQRDPQLLDAAAAVQHIIDNAGRLKRKKIIDQLRAISPDGQSSDTEAVAPHSKRWNVPGGPINVVFDVSDLVSYFQHERLPTGIQRVQIQVISRALLSLDVGVGICCLINGYDHWFEVPVDSFQSIVKLSLQSSDQKDPDWLRMLQNLKLQITLAKPFEFPINAYLVNLGGSWQSYNYFLFIRDAKTRYNIHYVPFVHDLIPIVAPEHFVKLARREFIAWVISIFMHADHFLVNSNATRLDLLDTGERLAQDLDPDSIAVIRLDADFRSGHDDAKSKPSPESALGQWLLRGETFVLIVSTVESRKGHATALDAWAQLIAQHGPAKMPWLVCAGKRGWLSDQVYQRLDDNLALASRVMMLSAVSDAELSMLYQNCLFTVYPSLYEGWGLPITESLCYAKPVIASNNSSLPEAGGDFAVYVDPGNSSVLAAALEMMIFDVEYRENLAVRIRAEFRPRSWDDLADQIWRELGRLSARDQNAAPLTGAPLVRLGAYYFVGRSTATRLWSGAVLGEAFRVGTGWSTPGEAGSWTHPDGGLLSIGLPPRHKPLCIGLLLLGATECHVDWRVWVKGGPSQAGSLCQGGKKWIMLIYPAINDGGILNLRLETEVDHINEVGNIGSESTYSVGLAGFFIYCLEDVESKENIMEAITLNNLDLVDVSRPNAPLFAADNGWDW